MKKRVQTFILLLVSLIASGIFWFAFEHFDILVIKSNLINISYIVLKIFALLAIVFVWIYGTKKKEPSNTYILGQTTIALQVVPLLVRLLGTGVESNFKNFLGLFITVLPIIGYIALAIIIDRSNDRILEVLPTLKGEEIKVVNDNDYYNEDGSFKGANKRGDNDEKSM